MLFWKQILQSIHQHKKGVLLYVLQSKGSSPGRQGFRMWISGEGEMNGSVGGGIMEHKLVQLAKTKLQNNDLTIVFKRQIHSKSVAINQSGMICSGEQSIALVPLTQKNIPLINKIIDCLEKGKIGFIQITCEKAAQTSYNALEFSNTKPDKPYIFNYINNQNWQYTEKIGFKKIAYIIGGGHVGCALSKVLVDLEFYCTIIDDRPNLHTLKHNAYTHQKLVTDYAELGKHIPEGDNIYLFIMTFGYRSDLQVLQQLIDKKLAFKGMMGSLKKVDKLMDEMKNLGYGEELLASVYSPIGLSIKSRTPQEIAISIAAQIIQLRNKNLP